MKFVNMIVLTFSAMSVNAQGLDRGFPQQAQYCESSSNSLKNDMGIQIQTEKESVMVKRTAIQGIVIRDENNRNIVWGLLFLLSFFQRFSFFF